MSQKDVERVHRVYEAVNRRDLSGLLALMDDDVDAVSILAGMEGEYHGHAGMRRWWGNLLEIFPDFAVEIVGVRDLEQVTLSAVLIRGHGVDSDTPFQMPIWQITRWREGQCTWWRSFATEAEALEAAGLREWAMSQERP